jgi:hypothetical protein
MKRNTKMSRITVRRAASALGATALIGLALAAPAIAKPHGPSTGSDPVSSLTSGDVRHHDTAGIEGPSTAELLRREKAYSYTMKPEAPKPSVKVITVDRNTIEYLQVGAGALAGGAIAGAGALVLSQSHRRRTAAV